MKDIGLKLKEKREENGVSIEEVAEDLKMRPSQIISLEESSDFLTSSPRTITAFLYSS